MLKVAKASISKGREAVYESDESLSTYPVEYPISSIKKCHYEATLIKVGNYIQCSMFINSELELIDTYDGVKFTKKHRVEETFDILDDEDGEGEGYIVKGNSIDLDELVVRVITSSLPIKVVRPGKKETKVNGPVEFMTEEAFIETQKEENPYNPAFDALADLDLGD